MWLLQVSVPFWWWLSKVGGNTSLCKGPFSNFPSSTNLPFALVERLSRRSWSPYYSRRFSSLLTLFPSISLSVYLCRAASSSLPSSSLQAHVCQEHSCDGIMTPTAEWLKMVLLPKIVQWSQENPVHASTRLRSVSLVPLDRYSKLYYKLKEKYGPPLVRVGCL